MLDDNKTLIISDLSNNVPYETIRKKAENASWEALGGMTIEEACGAWLDTLGKLTKENYRSGVGFLQKEKILDLQAPLQSLCFANREALLDRIKSLPGVSEATRQARAACLQSFLRFLERRTGGMIRRAVTCREGTTRTFYKIREKVTTRALTKEEWTKFVDVLESLSKRDGLIAKLCLQGGKRISEVLDLQIRDIDWRKSEITFKQSKTKGCEKVTVITIPGHLLHDLRAYVRDREGYVFITAGGKPVRSSHIRRIFQDAGYRAGIGHVSPHMLRASTITYLCKMGVNDREIAKVSGHASSQQVQAYDKTGLAENPSKLFNLV